jgi:hypothetical protein
MLYSQIKKIFYTVTIFTLSVVPAKVFGQSGSWIVCQNPPKCDFAEFIQTFQKILNGILQLGITLSVMAFVFAGWTYLTSGGDSGKVKKAHDVLTKTAIGFAILLAAFLIVELILRSLGVDVNNLEIPLNV